jgi:LysR family transcriptional regulator, regulator for bpeEF and oprC
MIISDILLFVRIAETLSFKDAAEHLGISRSQVSKRIAALEDDVGARLIYRSPRSISLTSAGETLLRYYRQIFETMEQARSALENLSTTCRGRLRFSMPTCLASLLLPRLHADFLPRHPDVVPDAHASDACVDIVSGGYDVVFRVAQRLCDSTLTARRLATSPLVVAAAPQYLARHGVPLHPSELARHQCLGLQATRMAGSAWQFHHDGERLNVPVSLSLVSDTSLALVPAASAGLGFVYLPMLSIARELRQGRLQPVLTEFCSGADWGVFAVHVGRTASRNAAALIEFVREAVAGLEGIDAPRPAALRVLPAAQPPALEVPLVPRALAGAV